MSWLFEDSTPLIVAGLLGEALLAVALVKSGRGVLVAVMVATLVLTIAGVVVEQLVVTDRERIEDTLHDVAEALEANDLPAVLSYIDDSAGELRGHLQSILPQLHISEAHVARDLEIRILRLSSPPSARADFTGHVRGSFGPAGSVEAPCIRHLTVEFVQNGDRWLVSGYRDSDPRGGVREN